MSGRYLLDTNIIIALFAGDEAVIEHLREADEVFVPVIAVGELYYGARRSQRRDANLASVDKFLRQNSILNCDIESASRYGEIKDALRKLGRPIPENDLWIAALAKQHNLHLVSRDEHFATIEDLALVKW